MEPNGDPRRITENLEFKPGHYCGSNGGLSHRQLCQHIYCCIAAYAQARMCLYPSACIGVHYTHIHTHSRTQPARCDMNPLPPPCPSPTPSPNAKLRTWCAASAAETGSRDWNARIVGAGGGGGAWLASFSSSAGPVTAWVKLHSCCSNR